MLRLLPECSVTGCLAKTSDEADLYISQKANPGRNGLSRNVKNFFLKKNKQSLSLSMYIYRRTSRF